MALSWQALSAQLADPFPASGVLWRAGSVSRDKKRAQALAYAEPRVYEDRLNDVLGPDWSCRFTTWGEQRLICELTVRFEDDSGELREITRTSSGEFDSGDRVAQGTAAEAQAFKRACSKFGLGRYLYDLPAAWVGYDENSRRLTETPNLPNWALPKPVPKPASNLTSNPGSSNLASAKPAATKTTPEPKLLATPQGDEATAAQPESPTLSQGRADAMQRELEKLGFVKAQQRKLAEQVLNHKVARFSQLTETEALEVWNVAKRTPVPEADTGTTKGHAVGF